MSPQDDVNRRVKLARDESLRQQNFNLDSHFAERESACPEPAIPASRELEKKKGAPGGHAPKFSDCRDQPIALTRLESRDIFRDAVFLW